ncbi:hypothetical protein CMI47_18340 [Candidatus Pacearchaeota archaeon]|nr:hypothetical protein [Candidatus Pacearchaeota archaeon]
MTNPICPACYSDTRPLPIDGLKYHKCINCQHSFSSSSIKVIKKITKRNIFNQTSNQSGLFDPFKKFNGTEVSIKQILKKFNIQNGELISNYNFFKKDFSVSPCEFSAECDIFSTILDSHRDKKVNNILSLCFMPFYNDIDNFITMCYKNTGTGDKTIILTNTTNSLIKRNIGQIHHFTSKSLHNILSVQQKNYDVFTVDNILGFILY